MWDPKQGVLSQYSDVLLTGLKNLTQVWPSTVIFTPEGKLRYTDFCVVVSH